VSSVYADIYKLWSSSLMRFFRFNQPWTGAFNVTDATRTHIAFVSSSPFFARENQKLLRALQPLHSTLKRPVKSPRDFMWKTTLYPRSLPRSRGLDSTKSKSQRRPPTPTEERALFTTHGIRITLSLTPYPISPIYLSFTRVILLSSHQAPKEPTMEWTAPKHEEIDLNCEISSYANAEL
jgi:hypothetical protein